MNLSPLLDGLAGSREPASNRTSNNRDIEQRMEANAHLVALPGTRWAVWKWVGLRAAGFPVAEVLKLSSSECSRAADHLIDAEQQAEHDWQQAFDALQSELLHPDPDTHALLVKAMRSLSKGKPPASFPPDCEAAQYLRAFASSYEQAQNAWPDFHSSFQSACTDISRAIRGIACDAGFREAIIWQNRAVFRTVIAHLAQDAVTAELHRDQKRRRGEELVANYWQRYCTKNDTIGFFGPVGWARFGLTGAAIKVSPGPSLIAHRNTYFDGWCIDALAETLGSDEAIRPWIAPRRAPTLLVEEDLVTIPLKAPVRLSAAEALVFRSCDGQRTAREIADELVGNPSVEIESEARLFQVLEGLQAEGFIYWSLDVPWICHPSSQWRVERNLERLLARIKDDALRERALAALDELKVARERVSLSAGDAEKLDCAMGEMEATFTKLTGADSKRAGGRMYAGRTLVYEDCVRDIDVMIGPELLAALSRPLSLILASARWYISKIAAGFRAAFKEVYYDLVRQKNSTTIDFQSFWSEAQALVFADRKGTIESLLRALQQGWSNILSLPRAGRFAEYDSEHLRPGIEAEFQTEGGGWQCARYYCPDVMIAARSADAILRGDYRFVLGECHIGANTLNKMVFAAQHPSPRELFQAFEDDLGHPLLFPVAPKYMMTQRTYSVFTSQKDYRLSFSRHPSGVESSRDLPIGSLVIEDDSGGLVVRTQDHRLQFDILDAFGDLLSERVANSFNIISNEHYRPRISIDRLIVSRESWQFCSSEMDFAYEKDEAHRFLGARQWARRLGLPRFNYFKSPIEVKPCFLDLESPVYVNIFAKATRRLAEDRQGKAVDSPNPLMTITEMLPTPDMAWLPDAQGKLYTSELRIVALDKSL